MAPIRATRANAVPRRPPLKGVNENLPSTAPYNLKPGAKSQSSMPAPPVKPGLNASERGILGEVTNALTVAASVVPTRKGAKDKPSVPLQKRDQTAETPKEQDNEGDRDVFTTPPENFEETVDAEGEPMELDATVAVEASTSGRTVDPVTGKELVYDLSKVIDFDGPNEFKIEEYAIYVQDVFNYYRQREEDKRFWVDPQYVSRQTDISWNMRAILMDWLVDLQESFALCHETLYLAVKIVDLYLTKATRTLPRDRLQLLGITSMFIASKYEERNYVRVDDLVYMTEDSYKVADVFAMEIEILKTIGFQLGHPMAYRFLRRFAKVRQLTMEVLTLSRYVLESSLMDHSFLGVRESHMAAGALYLARRMLTPEEEPWDDTLIHYSAVDKDTARALALRLNAMLRRPRRNLNTVQTKYDHEVFMKVGSIPKVPDTSV